MEGNDTTNCFSGFPYMYAFSIILVEERFGFHTHLGMHNNNNTKQELETAVHYTRHIFRELNISCAYHNEGRTPLLWSDHGLTNHYHSFSGTPLPPPKL